MFFFNFEINLSHEKSGQSSFHNSSTVLQSILYTKNERESYQLLKDPYNDQINNR